VEVTQPSALGPRTKSDAEAAKKAALKKGKAAAQAITKQHEAAAKAEREKIIPAHHFIVLPTGLGRCLGGGEKWEPIQIAGVHDEVAAHCGLFINGQNLDYDGLVDRVGMRVLGWCEMLR